MEQLTTIERADCAEGASENAGSSSAAFSMLVQTATLEFLATVQLLVERVRFVTGARSAALALKEDTEFVYCASCGSAGPQTGGPADMQNIPLRECVDTGRTIRCTQSDSTAAGVFVLAVPIIRAQKVSGFFEVRAGQAFRDSDVDAILRLTEMVNTALEHREAAEQVGGHLFEPTLEPATTHVTQSLRDADDRTPLEASPGPESPPPATLDFHGCKSCGFPVSLSRELCLDCEEKFPSANLAPSGELFALPEQESWVSAHGYTIASLVITALAAAIIYWLR